MSDSFINRNRKTLIIVGIIIATILAVTGFVAVAIVLILIMIGIKQVISKKNHEKRWIDKSKLIIEHDRDPETN